MRCKDIYGPGFFEQKINCEANASRAASFGTVLELTEWFQDLHRYPKQTMLADGKVNSDILMKLAQSAKGWTERCMQGMKARKEMKEQNLDCAEALYMSSRCRSA